MLKAQFNSDNQSRKDLYMGSYGLGLTRIIGAALEVLSSDDRLRWPHVFVPYSVVVIPPKVRGNNFFFIFCRGFLYYFNL